MGYTPFVFLDSKDVKHPSAKEVAYEQATTDVIITIYTAPKYIIPIPCAETGLRGGQDIICLLSSGWWP